MLISMKTIGRVVEDMVVVSDQESCCNLLREADSRV